MTPKKQNNPLVSNSSLLLLLSRKQYGDTVRTVHLRESVMDDIKKTYGTLPTSGKLARLRTGEVVVAFLCMRDPGNIELEYTSPIGADTIIAWAEYHSLQ